jgi:hypothetical protein
MPMRALVRRSVGVTAILQVAVVTRTIQPRRLAALATRWVAALVPTMLAGLLRLAATLVSAGALAALRAVAVAVRVAATAALGPK